MPAGRRCSPRATPVARAACLAVGLVLVDAVGPEGVAPFIYFRF